MVWAENRWIAVAGEWIEARSTASGVLAELDLPTEDLDPGAPRYEGVLSVVTDSASKGIRSLPLLHFGRAPIAAHRDISIVGKALETVVIAIAESPRRPTYLLHPCRVDGRSGLYGRDLFNRSAFRMKLRRSGMEFGSRFYAQMNPDGSFSAPDWPEMQPNFVILSGYSADDPTTIVTTEAGLLVYRFARYRIGPLQPAELKILTRLTRDLEGVAAGDPRALVTYLRGG